MNIYLLDFLRRLKLGHLNTNNPVLVYQMGKVASQSIYQSLKAIGEVNVYHVHRLNPDHIHAVREEYLRRGKRPPNEQKGLYLYRKVIKPRKPAKIITLVREPISRNISAFFENLDLFSNPNSRLQEEEITNLIDTFLREYNHDTVLNWFDIEMKSTTGINVYQYSFPKQTGYQIIIENPYQLLILRHDLDDETKASLIGDFLGLEQFDIIRANISEDKSYAEKYAAFLERIKIPTSYARRMYNSKYTKHFFAHNEIEHLFKSWTSSKS